jgi:two-component system chemotaxis response regulator CheB
VSRELETEVKIAMEDKAVDAGVMELGEMSPFTCADCHGTLLRVKAGGPVRFRCHTGHAFTADSLLSGMTVNVEDSLWSTIRALEEAEMLLRHMSEHLSAGARPESVAELTARADELRRRADLIRQAAMSSVATAAAGD